MTIIETAPVRILVVDDTATYRMIMVRAIEAIAGASVAGVANNGQLALEALENHAKTHADYPVDLVLLDVEMPVMNGFETLSVILKKYPKVGVVLISGVSEHQANLTIRGLEKGSLDFIPKPDSGSISNNLQELSTRLEGVVRAFRQRKPVAPKVTMIYTPSASSPVSSPSPPASGLTSRTLSPFDAIAIGVSTGGPNALKTLIPALSGTLGLPVFVVQHMPPVFTQSLANSLNTQSALTVKEAEDGEPVQPNTVFIAPGGRHMLVAGNLARARIVLDDSAPVNSCRPAADKMMESLASVYGGRILSVVMTGMGNDGTQGARIIKQAGGYCLTQSADSCVVYGMPRSVDEAGLSDEQVPLCDLAARIQQLVTVPGLRRRSHGSPAHS